MDYQYILYEKKDGVAIITINRPDKMNAMNRQLSAELNHALDEAEKDDEVAVMILTGGPKVFCAGSDLSEIQASPEKKVEGGGGPNAMEKIADTTKTTIAAIGGPCVAGGLELAMACDIRLAAETARIGDGHIKMGLMGPVGGLARLPRIVGSAMAKELILTGDLVDGTEACRIGLVNHVYPEDELLDKAIELASRIAKNPPTARRLSKKAINEGLQMNEYQALHHSMVLTRELSASPEFKKDMERIASFLSKNKK